MTYRVHADGSIEVETVDEAVTLSARIAGSSTELEKLRRENANYATTFLDVVRRHQAEVGLLRKELEDARKGAPTFIGHCSTSAVEIPVPDKSAPSKPTPLRATHIGGDRHVTGTDCCNLVPCPADKARFHHSPTTPEGACENPECLLGKDKWHEVEATRPDPLAAVGSMAWLAWFHEQYGRDPSASEMSAMAKGGSAR